MSHLDTNNSIGSLLNENIENSCKRTEFVFLHKLIYRVYDSSEIQSMHPFRELYYLQIS